MSGLPIYRLSKILGHASVTTTERYAHLTERVAADVLARADVGI